MGRVYAAVSPPCVTGVLSLRIAVSTDGRVSRVERLADTLVVDPSQLKLGTDPEAARRGVLAAIVDALDSASFPPRDSETLITIPFTFD